MSAWSLGFLKPITPGEIKCMVLEKTSKEGEFSFTTSSEASLS
jgi:hypothetical protein